MSLTHKQIKKSIWPDLKDITRPVAIRVSEVDMSIELWNGSMVYAASAENPDAVLGAGYHGVVLDEASRMDKDIWQRVIRPAIEDVGGWAAFISTPNGFNWFHKLYKSARSDTSGQWAAWQRPSRDNPLMSRQALDEMKLEIGNRAFLQECEAQFMAMDGAEWPPEYLPDSMWVENWPHPSNVYLTVISWDPSLGRTSRSSASKIKSDFSAVCVGKVDTQGQIYLQIDAERRDIVQTASLILDLCREHHPESVVVESNGMQVCCVTELDRQARERNMLIPLSTYENKVTKATRIKGTLTPYLARQDIKLVGHGRGNQEWFDEAVCFDKGEHDDALDASEMCIRKMGQLIFSGDNETDIDAIES